MFARIINDKNEIMKFLNGVKILMVCLLASLWTSCGDDVVYETMKNTDAALCAHTWTEEYGMTNEEGVLVSCVHQLKFSFLDHSGQEVYLYYYTGQSRPYSEVTHNFDWEWMDDTREGLRLDFGAGNVKYFENVWVREHYLSGKLDGKEVTLADANYR